MTGSPPETERRQQIAEIIRADTERDARRYTHYAHRPGWYTETCRDGGAHYGHRDSHDHVHAVCGRDFTPMRSVVSRIVMVRHRPVEPDHACTACLTAGAPTTSAPPVVQNSIQSSMRSPRCPAE